MRFSDMMGSASDPTDTDDGSDAVESALAPSLDWVASADAAAIRPEPVATLERPAAVAVAPAPAPVTPRLGVMPPSTDPAPVVALTSDPYANFPPLSDDLLPHRR